ncbi:NAD(P)H-dependent oxidoreductase [Kocuria carniphila]|uniref:NAD(P)H-dependent oxidoreductase n=1 Tax=Kocuria carniphila TaxID=262208 RepID=A0ABV3UXJ3_9MICC
MSTTTEHHITPSVELSAATKRVAVVSSSVRNGRMGPAITDWVVDLVKVNQNVEVDLIDLAEISLPSDRELYPGGGPKTEVSSRIEAAEAFVIVTPEYNHSYPASLKRLIDWHYNEWMFKPVMIVAYGVQGGYAAIEHLRGVLAELNMVTIQRCLGLPAPWNTMDEAERYEPGESVTGRLRIALAELDWWASMLTQARDRSPFPS